jgi:hypothetical protein
LATHVPHDRAETRVVIAVGSGAVDDWSTRAWTTTPQRARSPAGDGFLRVTVDDFRESGAKFFARRTSKRITEETTDRSGAGVVPQSREETL